MTEIILMGVLGVLLLAIVASLVAVLYWLPKRLGYPKVGVGLAWLAAGIFVLASILAAFADQLFSRNEAKVLLAEQGFTLMDDVELKSNTSHSAPGGDYYHSFTLRITARDKANMVTKIKKDWKSSNLAGGKISSQTDSCIEPAVARNYKANQHYVRESFKPVGSGYMERIVAIPEDKLEVTFIESFE